MSSFGTPAQQQLHKKFFVPFFHWQDDAKLREWLREQDPDELEQYLDWFDWTNHRDRETLGRQELRKLRNTTAKVGSISGRELPLLDKLAPPVEKTAEVITLKPGIWGMSIDLKEAARRLRRYFKS
jgi:hypothetical protein